MFEVTDVPPGVTPDIDLIVDGVAIGNPGTTSGGGTSKRAWRFFLDAGLNFAHDDFLKAFGGKWSANAGFERQLSQDWSVEGILGYHRFDNIASLKPHIWQLSVNGKRFFGASPLRPFLNAGLGAYDLDLLDTHAGANAGAGVLYEFTPTCGIEATWNYHIINTDSDSVSFSALQFGIRFAF